MYISTSTMVLSYSFVLVYNKSMSTKRSSWVSVLFLACLLISLALAVFFPQYRPQNEQSVENEQNILKEQKTDKKQNTVLIPKPTAVAQNAADASVYYGEYTPPWYPDISGTAPLETMVGKRASIVMAYTQWDSDVKDFNVSWFDQIRAHGSIPMLTWEPWVSLQTVYSGKYDTYIAKWAQDSKTWGHPYFLRFAHEMNGDWYPWSERVNASSPGDYVKAWKHVHDIFTAHGATNTTWVWCPNSEDPNSTPLADLYPGNGYVDWTCMDGYNFGGLTFSQVFSQTYNNLLQLAPTKPIMIGETSSTEDGSKAVWITDALTVQLPRHFAKIKAFVWYDADKDNFSGKTGWIINSSKNSLAAFQAGIALSYYASNAFWGIDSSPILPLRN
jgi:hypothetical protein